MVVNKAVVISGVATAIIVVVVSIPIILSNSGAGKDLWMGNHGEMDSIVAGPCVKTYFGKWGLIKPEGYQDPRVPYVAFSNTDPDAGEAKGCLIVNWKKKTNVVENPAADKSKVGWWRGVFRWELTLSKGDEGFVFAGGASNGKTAQGKLDVAVKLVGLKKKNKYWNVEYYKEERLDNVASSDDEKKFPRGFRSKEYRSGTLISSLRSWGFTPWYDKSCKWNPNDENIEQQAENCRFAFSDSPEFFKNRWEWKENASGGHTFSYVFSNFEKMWENNFKNKLTLNNAKDIIGIWTQY